ncbi:hypothetical protein BX283_0014 [Streptomyces sp. TLI_146]|nr:hypothetical protein BX283_0014 [Streptomyces sp. TLI_146]
MTGLLLANSALVLPATAAERADDVCPQGQKLPTSPASPTNNLPAQAAARANADSAADPLGEVIGDAFAEHGVASAFGAASGSASGTANASADARLRLPLLAASAGAQAEAAGGAQGGTAGKAVAQIMRNSFGEATAKAFGIAFGKAYGTASAEAHAELVLPGLRASAAASAEAVGAAYGETNGAAQAEMDRDDKFATAFGNAMGAAAGKANARACAYLQTPLFTAGAYAHAETEGEAVGATLGKASAKAIAPLLLRLGGPRFAQAYGNQFGAAYGTASAQATAFITIPNRGTYTVDIAKTTGAPRFKAKFVEKLKLKFANQVTPAIDKYFSRTGQPGLHYTSADEAFTKAGFDFSYRTAHKTTHRIDFDTRPHGCGSLQASLIEDNGAVRNNVESGEISTGTLLELYAQEEARCVFDHWVVDGQTLTDRSRGITIPVTRRMEIVAHFR